MQDYTGVCKDRTWFIESLLKVIDVFSHQSVEIKYGFPLRNLPIR